MGELSKTAYAADQTHKAGHMSVEAGRALGTGDLAAAIQDLIDAEAFAHQALIATVAAWRARGATWAEIGESYGVSRQAAWERFGTAAKK